MKKLLVLFVILAIALTVGLVACGEKDSPADTSTPSEQPAEDVTPDVKPDVEPTPVKTFNLTIYWNLSGVPALNLKVSADALINVDSIVLPTPDGKELVGFYTDSACTQSVDFATFTLDSNVAIYAKWQSSEPEPEPEPEPDPEPDPQPEPDPEPQLNKMQLALSDNGVVIWEGTASSYDVTLDGGETVEETTNLFYYAEVGSEVSVKPHGDDTYDWSSPLTVTEGVGRTEIRDNYYQYATLSRDTFGYDAINSVGTNRILVIPVWFADSSKYIKSSVKDKVYSDIYTAYFGTEEETGWHSVRSYYLQDSYGKVTLDGDMTGWYNTTVKATDFDEETGQELLDELIAAACLWAGEQDGFDLTDYDLDSNGYIDAVCLIYAAPNYSNAPKGVTLDEEMMWAFCFYPQNDPQPDEESPTPYNYFWASYDFMYADTSHCTIDAHTFIHEMGHIFGLLDYYDYGEYAYSPAGDFSMQDYNVGTHDPYSKLALDWTEPYVVTDTTTLTIRPFESSGDVILIAPSFSGSVFDEYILLELYTPTGLNWLDSHYDYDDQHIVGPTVSGIRVWHVDSRLIDNTDGNYSHIYAGLQEGRAAGLAIDNTFDDGNYFEDSAEFVVPSSFRDMSILQLIRNSTTDSYLTGYSLYKTDLFFTGDTFTLDRYRKQFAGSSRKTGKLDDGSKLGYTITFDFVSDEGATITITKD